MKVALKNIASLRSGSDAREPSASRTGASPPITTAATDTDWNIREMFTKLLNNTDFTATLLIFSGATVLLGIIWIYRYVKHDPHLDTSSGVAIPLLLLFLAGVVLVWVIIRRRTMHGR